MSWHFSQALVEAFSEANSSDGGLFAPWSSTPSAPDDSCSDRMKGTFHRSPFGMMYAPSTDAPGEALLTWFLEASRARTSARQETERGSTERGAGSGRKWLGSFARWDRATSSWRTAQCSLFGGLTEFSGTWPRWGAMRDGACWERQAPAWTTGVNGSGLLPTPCASDWQPICWARAERLARGEKGRPEGAKGGCSNLQDSLAAGWLRRMKRDLRPERGSMPRANPLFWEHLMGWPLGWTGLTPLGTDKFRAWWQQHGGYSDEMAEAPMVAEAVLLP